MEYNRRDGMVQKIDGHIIDASLLSDGDWILDAGCRGFALAEKLPGNYNFLCIDPDPKITLPDIPIYQGVFEAIALMPYDGEVGYCGWSTGEGNYCYKDKAPWYVELDIKVPCRTVKTLMKKYGIDKFGLAKIDIEGAEYDVLLSIDFPFAKQISVEFHQSLGYNHYGTHADYMEKLMKSEFGKYYQVAEFYNYEAQGLSEYLFILNKG